MGSLAVTDASISKTFRVLRVAAIAFGIAAFSLLAAEQPQMSLDDKEQLDVQRDLYWLTMTLWILVIGLLAFAYSIRFIAKRTTRPCRWCSEFISNKATVCPRCGKKLDEIPFPCATVTKPT